MKNNYLIITSFLLIFFSTKIAAQGTLQFNQVITQNLGTSYIVPAGKVFKLEMVSSTSATRISINIGPLSFEVKGYSRIGAEDIGSSGAENSSLPFPIWLKAGDVINCAFVGFNVAISGIEFNIIP